jgi:WD40 repeat protein
MQKFAGGWILHPNSPTPCRVDPGRPIGVCTVSPDGSFVGFAVQDDRIKVYAAANAECVWQSAARKGHYCRFSPDGRWLATDVDGGQLYALRTWQPGPQLGPGIPWDLTSELAVLGLPEGIYRLVELATGRELARLEDPELNAGPAAFTPDGSKLVVAASNGLRVWDLRLISTELDRLGLSWDLSLPPATAVDPTPEGVTIDTGNLKTALESRMQGWPTILQKILPKAVEDFGSLRR